MILVICEQCFIGACYLRLQGNWSRISCWENWLHYMGKKWIKW